jgi:L-ascorbate metabolism protein UlaG (beta-lactamase superfamily)
VLAGLGTAALLKGHGIERAEDLDWWQGKKVGGEVRVTFAPAQHWSTRVGLDRNYNLWGSFYLSAGEERVYFAGDTGGGPHFRMVRDRLGAPTLALLPIGAYLPRWFMEPQHIDPAEAVAAHRELGARRSVAIHWGTFRQADEGMEDPVVALRAALRARGVAPEDFAVLENGQSLFEETPASSR